MPDVTPDFSDPHPLTTAPSASAPPGEPDPFQTLFKMSTTAGLGSAEYVAINGTSIAAILLGIASALVLFGSLLLLLIPAAGIVCAVLAFRQIKGSNGTQTGTILAIAGFLLSLGLGGYYVGREATAAIQDRSDQRQIIDVIRQMGSLIHDGKYEDAYRLSDDRFQQRVAAQVFADKWKMASGSPYFGKVVGLDWNNLLKFEADPVTTERLSSGMVLLAYEKVPGRERIGMVFRQVNGKWMMDDIPSMFPAENPQAAPGGQQPQRRPTAAPAGPPAPGA